MPRTQLGGGRFTEHLSPRRSLRARVALVFGSSTLVLALLLSLIVGAAGTRELERRVGGEMGELAFQMSDKLERGMFERYRDIQIAATLEPLRDGATPPAERRALLETLQRTYPDYAWIGLADPQGRVLVSTGGLLEGQDVSPRPWFQGGRTAPYVGDVHEAVLLAKLLPNPSGEPKRFVDVATPVYDRDGALLGVLGAHLSWQWAREVERSLLAPLTEDRRTEMVIASPQGLVLQGPPGLVDRQLSLDSVRFASAGRSGYQVETWPDGRRTVTGYHQGRGYRNYPGLGWIVLVRQDTAIAFAPAQRAQQQILLLGLALGGLFAALGWLLAGRLTRPLLAIARAADRIRRGETSAAIPTFRGRDEVSTLAGSLGQLVATQQAQQRELLALNEQLRRDIAARERAEDTLQREREFLAAVLDNLEDGIVACDADGALTIFNRATRQLHGLPEAPLPPERWAEHYDLYRPDGRTPMRTDEVPLVRAYRGETVRDAELVIAPKSGSPHTLLADGQPIIDGQGRKLGAVVAMHDITERKRAEAALRASEVRHRAVVDTAFDAIVTLDAGGRLQSFNRSAERIFGYEAGEVLGRQLSLLMAAQFQPAHGPGLAALLNAGEAATPGRIVELVGRRKDGSEFPLELSLAQVGEGPDLLITAILRDITERKAFEAQLRHQAFHDALTGLPNRALLLERLGHALARAARRRQGAAVLYVDLDRFKAVNDSLGHAAGDALLVATGQRLARCVRPEDTVARLGGDEFVVLLEDVDDVTGAAQVAERIISACAAPFTVAGHEIVVTPSVGIALSTPGHESPEDLVRDADVAMYRVKARGRASYEIFDPRMNARALERLDLEGALRRAIARDQLLIYYQPKVELATGQIVGVEALVRWQHPTRGLVSPTEFIPLAEETGLIVPLGRWVLEAACRQVRAWQARYPDRPPLALGVNLSVRQLQRRSIAEEVAELLAATAFDPRSLILEITESILMADAEANIAILRRLKGLGVRLAIDDFGTGYSSLAYLRRFPVDILKIDRAFVAGLGRVAEDDAIVRAVLGLARALGLQAVAEGIENAEQLAALRSAGCGMGQGFYFSRPLPAEAMGTLLRQGERSEAALSGAG